MSTDAPRKSLRANVSLGVQEETHPAISKPKDTADSHTQPAPKTQPKPVIETQENEQVRLSNIFRTITALTERPRLYNPKDLPKLIDRLRNQKRSLHFEKAKTLLRKQLRKKVPLRYLSINRYRRNPPTRYLSPLWLNKPWMTI